MATESNKVNLGTLAALGAILALALVGLVAAVTVMAMEGTALERTRKGGAVNTRPFRDLADAQRADLTEDAEWLDQQAGILSISIDRAMELVIEELARDPTVATPRAATDAPATAGSVGVGADSAATRTDPHRPAPTRSTAASAAPQPDPPSAQR
ncbi:MAG: hypothetical protein JW751_05005 [Polyangiaceae bacterium]|nr:hypothetical protein [Polyangiaceae bacterium]